MLETFKNEEFGEVRVLEQNGEPWFIGQDVVNILGYKNGSRDINRHVDKDDRQNYQNGTLETNRGMTIINESGLYSLILSSKLPKAKEFKKWVTTEVLPSIRKTGGYIYGEEIMSEDQLILATMNVLNKKIKNLQVENAKQQQIIGELKPKADYTDIILKSKDLLIVSSIAKDYGMTATALNKKLHELGVQYKIGKQWLLYAKYQDKGYTHSETTEFTHSDGKVGHNILTKWTQKGRLFLYNLLKENNILPMIEREN